MPAGAGRDHVAVRPAPRGAADAESEPVGIFAVAGIPAAPGVKAAIRVNESEFSGFVNFLDIALAEHSRPFLRAPARRPLTPLGSLGVAPATP